MDHHYNELATERELVEILSHYNSNYIYDILLDHIVNESFLSVNNLNIIAAWEQNFKAIIETYGVDWMDKIKDTREECYKQVIQMICEKYNLNFTIDENVDLYSAAFTLYEVFIRTFPQNIISFFANYIYANYEMIFNSMNLSEVKKNKDSSTVYGRKVYKDIKLAAVTANLYKVLNDTFKSIDFKFDTIVLTWLYNKDQIDYILKIVSDNGDFYHDIIIPRVNRKIAEYVTYIRFEIQKLASINNQILYNSAEDANSGEEAKDDEGDN